MTNRTPAARMNSVLENVSQLLADVMDAGVYQDGHEYVLADEVFEALPRVPMNNDEVIFQLVHDKVSSVVLTDCLLDETADETYQAIQTVADVLVRAILAEGDTEKSAKRLIVNSITDRADLTREIKRITSAAA